MNAYNYYIVNERNHMKIMQRETIDEAFDELKKLDGFYVMVEEIKDTIPYLKGEQTKKERIRFKFIDGSDYFDCEVGTWNKLLDDLDDETNFVLFKECDKEYIFAKFTIERIELEIIEEE